MFFPLGRPVRWAHHIRIFLAAGAIVVAHLYRTCEAAPCRPVQRGREFVRPVTRLESEKTPIIHLGRIHDLAWIEGAARIEQGFHPPKGVNHPFPKHRLVEL